MKGYENTFFIGSLQAGGAERVAVRLSEAFIKELNWELILITGDRIDNDFYSSDIVMRRSLAFNYNTGKDAKEQFRRVSKIREFIKKENADILVFSSIDFALRGIFSSIGLNVPIIVCEHNNYFAIKSRVKKLVRILLYPFADKVFLLTKRDLGNYPLLIRKRCEVVPNPLGIDGKWVAREFNHQLLAVGRLSEQKAFHRLLDVFVLLPDYYTLNILGEGELEKQLKDRAYELDIDKRVNFVGIIQDIESYYERASVLLMTSIYEGLPMVIAEANAFALPVISYNCETGPREMIDDGINGYLIAEDDSRGMVNRIIELANDKLLYKRMCKHAFEYAQTYSINNTIRYWKKNIYGLVKH